MARQVELELMEGVATVQQQAEEWVARRVVMGVEWVERQMEAEGAQLEGAAKVQDLEAVPEGAP